MDVCLEDIEPPATTFEWLETPPKTVLIVKKQRDPLVSKWLNTIAGWLVEKFQLRVLVEADAAADSPYVQTYL